MEALREAEQRAKQAGDDLDAQLQSRDSVIRDLQAKLAEHAQQARVS